MRVTLQLLFVLLFSGGSAMATAGSGSGGINAPEQQAKPYVVLVSLDGFHQDYAARYPTPNIQRLLAAGSRAESLVPVWPTLTFPNHYSQVTGLTPAQHGLVGNEFPLRPGEGWFDYRDRETVSNGRLYDGTPIWVLAEQQGMVSASFFWVGSEADVQGVQPTYWRPYDYTVSHEVRVDQVIAWLQEPAETRPHLITLYLGIVDDRSHRFGIDSDEMIAAIDQVDRSLGRLMDGLDALPIAGQVYLLVVSDHGQMGYRNEPPFIVDEHVDLEGLEINDEGPVVYLWGADPERAAAMAQVINGVWTTGTAYTRSSAPPEWGLPGNPRMPDLVLQADAGYGVIPSAGATSTLSIGDHGWTPDVPEMQGIFWARGPGITAGNIIPALHATDIFPLLVGWLGLEPPAGYTRIAPVNEQLEPR